MPYTDLLLHDMVGDPNNPNDGAGADICVGDATPDEFRTEPLMGLRFVEVFMHDGSATTIEEAILAHGGEGQASTDAFLGLSEKERSRLMEFLNTL